MAPDASALQSVQNICDNATIGLYSAATSLQANGNLLISPLSIVYASLLLYLGSSGDTKSNLDQSLHFSDNFGPKASDLKVLPAFADALTLLKVSNAGLNSLKMTTASSRGKNRQQNDLGFQLAIANGIFVENTYKLDRNYVNNATRYLRASVTPENFLTDSEGSRKDINKWVDGRTGGKIKDLIPTGAVDVSTKAVLVNAVYFKARWETVFETTDTKKGDFSLLTGKKASVDLMHLTKMLTYTENKELGCQYLELPYRDFEASLLVLLPRKVDGLRQLEKALTPELLRTLSSDADDSNVIDLTLPKFTFGSSFDLVKLMQKIGVNDVFTADADLSAMAPDGEVQVSAAFHKTFIGKPITM